MSISGSDSASASQSKGKSTTVSSIKLSKTSKALRDILLQYGQQALGALSGTADFAKLLQNVPGLIQGFSPNLDMQEGSGAEAFSDQNQFRDLENQLRQSQLGFFTNGQGTPEQMAGINNAADLAIQAGTGDINQQLQTGLGLLRSELAPGLGLRPSDSPILDRGGRLVEQSLKDTQNLSAGIRSQAAFEAPLALNQAGQGEQNIINQTKDLQSQLLARAYQNRLALTGQAGGLGLGIASSYNPAGSFAASANADPRGEITHSKSASVANTASVSASYGGGGGGMGG